MIRRTQFHTLERMSATLIVVLGLMSTGCGQVKDMLGFGSKPSRATARTAGEQTATGSPNDTAPATSAAKGTAVARKGTRSRTNGVQTSRTSDSTGVQTQAALNGTPESHALVTAPTVRNNASAADAASASTPGAEPPAPQPVFIAAGDERSPVYSSADRDVTPARLLTEQKPGVLFRNHPADTNTMELIISKQGRVEQVRLISQTKRMTDMLLLSGAKTWKFAPATKDGVPVRYRTHFSWETTP